MGEDPLGELVLREAVQAETGVPRGREVENIRRTDITSSLEKILEFNLLLSVV